MTSHVLFPVEMLMLSLMPASVLHLLNGIPLS